MSLLQLAILLTAPIAIVNGTTAIIKQAGLVASRRAAFTPAPTTSAPRAPHASRGSALQSSRLAIFNSKHPFAAPQPSPAFTASTVGVTAKIANLQKSVSASAPASTNRPAGISPRVADLQKSFSSSPPQLNSAPSMSSLGADQRDSNFKTRVYDSAALPSRPMFAPHFLPTASKAVLEGTQANAPSKPAAATALTSTPITPSTPAIVPAGNVMYSKKSFQERTKQSTPQSVPVTSRGPFVISDKTAKIKPLAIELEGPAVVHQPYNLLSKMEAAKSEVDSLFMTAKRGEMADVTLFQLMELWREDYSRLLGYASATTVANDKEKEAEAWLENTAKLADLLKRSFCAPKDDRQWTPLQMAVAKADTKMISELLANPYLDTPAHFNYALKIATMNGYEEMAELLLKDGRANYRDASEQLTSELAHSKMKRLFKDLVPFLESIKPNGPDPLVWVMKSEDLLDKLSRKQYEILLARARNFPKVVEYLTGKKAYLEEAWEAKLNELSDAASINDSNKVDYLLGKIDPRDNGSTALQKACEKGNLVVVQVLLKDRRSDPAVGNGVCLEPFIELGLLDLARNLLDSTKVDVMLNEGKALRQAILSKNVELVEAVLNKAKFKYLKEVDSPEGNEMVQTLKQIYNWATDDNIRGLISTAFPDVNFEESYWDYMKSYLPTYWM